MLLRWRFTAIINSKTIIYGCFTINNTMDKQLRSLRIFTWLFLANQIAFFAMAWSSTSFMIPGMFVQVAPKGMSFDDAHALLDSPRLLGIFVGLPAVVTLTFGLWRLDRLSRNNGGMAMFSLENIGHLRAFAGATALSTMLSILEVPVRNLVFRKLLGFKDVHVKVGVSSDELLLILVCLTFFLITYIMKEARRIAKENEGFV